MTERALKCPQCNAPLPASRFARSIVCPFCGTTVLLDEAAVPVARFRRAFAQWNSPETHGYDSWISLGDRHWALGPLVARGEFSDVHTAQRARWPGERALVKILRDRRDAPGLEREWAVLSALQEKGGASFAGRLPQPLLHGEVTAGAPAGRRALLLLWASGFVHTFEAVAQVHPRGIEPRAAIWVWRRILELLAFLHTAGYAHGAVLPPHLLVENGEHGVRLVGFRAAGRLGEPLAEVSARWERVYPKSFLAARKLSCAADLAMSARAVATLLDGDPATGAVPGAVPAPLAGELEQAVALKTASEKDAWSLRQRLGELALEVFGPPAFCPIDMPEEA